MKYSIAVKYWLFLGLFLVFMQIIIGGITRLTGSGLSITEWDIVMGTFPPLGEDEWAKEFSKYQETPQYKKINDGMSLKEFRFIYFWEYFHRLWARMMGFVFLIPFIFFSLTKRIDGYLIKRLGLVIGFAALAAIFGWIMVASGLVNRPWVNAYKLSIHLSIGIAVFLSLLWCILEGFYRDVWANKRLMINGRFGMLLFLFILICCQIVFGGIVSGMKAALPFPTWPDMNGSWIPPVLMDGNNWRFENLENYERSSFAPALIQFIHRNTAYAITVLSVLMIAPLIRSHSWEPMKYWGISFLGLLGIQVLLGILTLVGSLGNVPVGLGVLHQGVGVLLLASLFVILYMCRTMTSRITS